MAEAAVRGNGSTPPATANAPVLEVKGLKKHFPIKKGLLSRTAGYVYAVDGVSFDIKDGETLGLVFLAAETLDNARARDGLV